MLRRREFLNRVLVGGSALATVSTVPRLLPENPNTRKGKWKIGHHFFNWDHAWNKAEFLDQRLRLTKETGYEGWEAKPEEIGQPAEEVRDKCAALGIECAAIGGDLKLGVDYAHAAGAKIVRLGIPPTILPIQETKRWVEYAGERGIICVVHPHLARPGTPGAVQTQEDLVRYIGERPGIFACPDTGHLALSGSDPVKGIRDLGKLCRYIHLKDIRADQVGKRNVPGEKFCELGTGALDLPGVMKALEDIGYEGWIMIERDSREPDYVQSAKNMRAVMRRFGY